MKEVNINIEGYNVNGICVGCLNYNRRMFYHARIRECFRLLGNIDVPDGLEVQVCWECLARVKSAINFREQMLTSYDILISYSKEHTFLDSPNDFDSYATTNIERTGVQYFECMPEAELGEVNETDVKEEEEIEEREIEDKYGFEVAIKEETFDDSYYEDAPAVDNDVTSDEDLQLSKLKEKETERGKKKRKSEKKKERERDRMPANKRPRKTTRGLYDISQFEAAYDQIVNHGVSVRQAGKMFNITHVTLQRYKKRRQNTNFPVKVGYARNSIYTPEQETILMNYLKKYAEIYPGLCVRVVRKYATEFSQKLGLKTPKAWVDNEMAGIDWYRNFMYRNKDLEDKLNRQSAKEKVKVFYDRLWSILGQYNFGSENIYSLDEIGVNIEEFRDKIWLMTTKNGPIALKESKVMFTYAANAKGYAIPPLFLIPREKKEETSKNNVEVKIEKDLIDDSDYPNETTFNKFLKNGVDLKNLPDWTEDSNFLVFLKHFTKNLRNSVGPKLLLLLENQTFHLSIECIEYCQENDIILLVIPSYMAQVIEPLHPIIRELKKTISSMYKTLVLEKPENKKCIYIIPNMLSEGLLKCLDQKSIKEGFKNAGIFPYNREVIINGLEGNNVE